MFQDCAGILSILPLHPWSLNSSDHCTRIIMSQPTITSKPISIPIPASSIPMSSIPSTSTQTSTFTSTSLSQFDYTNIDWNHINKAKFYIYVPIGSISIRTLFFPLALIKTRVQTASMTIPTGLASTTSTVSKPISTSTSTSTSTAPSMIASSATSTPTSTSTASHQHLHPTSTSTPHHPPYRGTFDAFRTILRTEGVRGLYRGFEVSMLTLATIPVYLSTLEYSRTLLKHTSSICHTHPQLLAFISGGMASIIASSVSVPLDGIAQKMMISRIQKTKVDTSAFVEAYRIGMHTYHMGGFAGLYRGYFTSICTTAPFSAIMWTVFGECRTQLRRFLPDSSPASSHAQWQPEYIPLKSEQWRGGILEMWSISISSFIAGSTAALLTNPLDIIRTRLQVTHGKHITMRHIIQDLYHQKGFIGFLTGASARMLQHGPSSALLMFSYEVMKRASVDPNAITTHLQPQLT